MAYRGRNVDIADSHQ